RRAASPGGARQAVAKWHAAPDTRRKLLVVKILVARRAACQFRRKVARCPPARCLGEPLVPRQSSGVRNQSRRTTRIGCGGRRGSPVSRAMAQPQALLTAFWETLPSRKYLRRLGRAAFAFIRPSVTAHMTRTWGNSGGIVAVALSRASRVAARGASVLPSW